MRGSPWLASPLAGTVGVLTGLCLLAIPLWKLTSGAPAAVVVVVPSHASTNEVHAVLRFRLLAAARQVTLRSAAGKTLFGPQDVALGESETDVLVALDGGHLDLTLCAELGGGVGETAVFLTVMPDGYEDQTRYLIGSGTMEETLSYDWHAH